MLRAHNLTLLVIVLAVMVLVVSFCLIFNNGLRVWDPVEFNGLICIYKEQNGLALIYWLKFSFRYHDFGGDYYIFLAVSRFLLPVKKICM